MKFLYLASLLLVVGIAAGPSCAQAKKTSLSSGKGYAKIWESYSQKVIPGVRGQEITTEYQFLVIWQSTQKPETFFWKSPEAWMNCAVYRLHKKKAKDNTNTWFQTEEIDLEKVRKGDTLVLVPVKGGKFVIPTTVPSSLKNIILFKTTKSNWLFLQLNKMTKLPDIIMS
jgi:hypothetical protein